MSAATLAASSALGDDKRPEPKKGQPAAPALAAPDGPDSVQDLIFLGDNRPIFLRLFQEYGLPGIIRTDNGVPFATTALGRLSTLSVWWIRLGILPELIAPASPQQNGRHERMHRTLKAEATRPPSANLRAQQARFGVQDDLHWHAGEERLER